MSKAANKLLCSLMKSLTLTMLLLIFSQSALARTVIKMYEKIEHGELNDNGLAVNSVTLSGNIEFNISSLKNSECFIESVYALVPTSDPKIMNHLNAVAKGGIFTLSINSELVKGTKVSVKCAQQAYEFIL